jgi:hypothetical protein
MKGLKIIILLLLVFSHNTYGQTNSSENKSKLIINFFQSKSTIDFIQNPNDTIINIIDIDSILTKAKIIKWGDKLLNVVSKSETVLKIKKEGIFCSFKDEKLFYIFSSNKIGKVTYYRIFRPRTGADCYIGIVRKNKRYLITKRGKGWF